MIVELNGHTEMVFYKISKSSLRGTIQVPSSKSHTLRAILFAALADGQSTLSNYLPSTDASAMIQACCSMGAKIEILQNNTLQVEGINGAPKVFDDVIQSGNSGIVLRFIAAIAALSPNYAVITGDYSIRHQRPVKSLLEGLNGLGVFAASTRGDGFAPILVKGPMTRSSTTIDGKDSQPVSALLTAAAFRDRPTEIQVGNPGEKPWIDLTLDWFKRLEIPIRHHDYKHYEVPGNTHLRGFNYTVPADFSSAAFPIAAALITDSELTLENMDMRDVQGDKEFIFSLQAMGARIEIDPQTKSITVKRGGVLRGGILDINGYIDAVPIMAVTACFAEGETKIINAAVAREKECDRLHAITTELRKMGAKIEELPDGLIIQPSKLKGASLKSYDDHRMVMALSVAAMGASGESTIDQAESVAKTFPNFAPLFQSMGTNLSVIE